MAVICCRRRRGWPCVSGRQADVGGASRHGCNVVPQKTWMGQAERMKRRTYVKMSTWMQPVVCSGSSARAVSSCRMFQSLLGEFSQGQVRHMLRGPKRPPPPHAFGPCCRCRGWRGQLGFSAFLSALSSCNRRLGIFLLPMPWHMLLRGCGPKAPKHTLPHDTALDPRPPGATHGMRKTTCTAQVATPRFDAEVCSGAKLGNVTR